MVTPFGTGSRRQYAAEIAAGAGSHFPAVRPWHHRDPFDRLLIAQASVENLPIVNVDTAFDDYAVTRLW